jgi:hypothetical protein
VCVAGAGLRAHADDDVPSLEGSWRITISAPPACQDAPPACITASEFSNFYPGGTLTETNTILFAGSEPNPPNFSSASDGLALGGGRIRPMFMQFGLRSFYFRPRVCPLMSRQPTNSWQHGGRHAQREIYSELGRNTVRDLHHHHNSTQQRHRAFRGEPIGEGRVPH